jgi:hypothetical protein
MLEELLELDELEQLLELDELEEELESELELELLELELEQALELSMGLKGVVRSAPHPCRRITATKASKAVVNEFN